MEYRELFLALFRKFDERWQPRSYLRDLVETTHLFLKMLERFCRNRGNLIVQVWAGPEMWKELWGQGKGQGLFLLTFSTAYGWHYCELEGERMRVDQFPSLIARILILHKYHNSCIKHVLCAHEPWGLIVSQLGNYVSYILVLQKASGKVGFEDKVFFCCFLFCFGFLLQKHLETKAFFLMKFFKTVHMQGFKFFCKK